MRLHRVNRTTGSGERLQSRGARLWFCGSRSVLSWGTSAIVMLSVLSGCQTEKVTTSDGGPARRKPTPPPRTPAEARANQMAFFVGQKPEDTNGNGFPDLINVTVLLFASPHPTSILQDGHFEFMLYPQGRMGEPQTQPIGTWKMEGEVISRAHTLTINGPAYQFRLSMLDPQSRADNTAATDKLPLEQADLVCTFVPRDGSEPVRSDGVRTIQIGRRFAGGPGT